jgi:hypothetical protein
MNGIRCLLVLASLSLFAGGCASPCTSTGWSFQVGKPAVMTAPAAVAQGPASLALYPVGAAPAAPPARGMAMAADAPCLPPPSPLAGGGMLAATAPGCDLNEICRRLERIERRLGGAPGVPTPQPRPLPPGPPSAE